MAGLDLGDIVLGALDQKLEIVVTTLLHLVRHRRKDTTQRGIAVLIIEIHARVSVQVALGHRYLDTISGLHEDGQEDELILTERGETAMGIGVFK